MGSVRISGRRWALFGAAAVFVATAGFYLGGRALAGADGSATQGRARAAAPFIYSLF